MVPGAEKLEEEEEGERETKKQVKSFDNLEVCPAVVEEWEEVSCLPPAHRRYLQRDHSALGCLLWNLQRTRQRSQHSWEINSTDTV